MGMHGLMLIVSSLALRMMGPAPTVQGSSPRERKHPAIFVNAHTMAMVRQKAAWKAEGRAWPLAIGAAPKNPGRLPHDHLNPQEKFQTHHPSWLLPLVPRSNRGSPCGGPVLGPARTWQVVAGSFKPK